MDTNKNHSDATTPKKPELKAVYAKPRLVEYGDVRELTRSNPTGSQSDGFRLFSQG